MKKKRGVTLLALVLTIVIMNATFSSNSNTNGTW